MPLVPERQVPRLTMRFGILLAARVGWLSKVGMLECYSHIQPGKVPSGIGLTWNPLSAPAVDG